MHQRIFILLMVVEFSSVFLQDSWLLYYTTKVNAKILFEFSSYFISFYCKASHSIIMFEASFCIYHKLYSQAKVEVFGIVAKAMVHTKY